MPFAASGAAIARALAVLSVAASLALGMAFAAPAPAVQAGASEAQRVVASAESHLGSRWSYAATGPSSFDCSGLVFRVFKENALLDRIGGRRRTVAGFYRWFRDRGLTSRSNPRVGDLIVWGRNKHIGIYVGDGMAISTLTSGVRRHRVHGLNDRFKAYLHVSLER